MKKIYRIWLAVLSFQMCILPFHAKAAESPGLDSAHEQVWWTDPPHTYSPKRSTPVDGEVAIPPTPRIIIKTSLCAPSSRCDKMTLMYSENDAICKPLLNIYQKYWDKQEKKVSTVLDRVWWEDSQPELFIQAGFIRPLPLQDELHAYIPTTSSMSGEELAIVYYKLRLDSQVEKQIVLLQDSPYRSHGYHSDIYVSEPGEDISIFCGSDFYGAASPKAYMKPCEVPNPPIQLAFATYFFDYPGADRIHADKLISLEYVFEKNDTYKKYAYVYDDNIIRVAVGISDEIIQRVYLFHDHPIFIARSPNSILVYRIKNGSEIDDVCHIASDVAKINR
jgi:hypothetical protein